MYRHFVDATILNRKTQHGHSTQYQVALTDSEGNKEFLWMNDYDYIDWIEVPLVLTGKTFAFDPSTYHAFA